MGKRSARLILSVLFGALGSMAHAACSDDRVDLRGPWGQASFTVEIADDASERNRGLMHVEHMPRFEGMLFIYDSERPVAFWMKNTLIPLDMIFVGADGIVQSIHDRAVPHDLTPIPSGAPVQYVLEVNGGMAEMLGIGEGTQVRHPAIANGTWTCE